MYLFEIGDRIRLNRSANTRRGRITRIDDDGAVYGEFDEGLPFGRGPSQFDELRHDPQTGLECAELLHRYLGRGIDLRDIPC